MSLELDYDYFIQIREAFKKKIKSVDFFHTSPTPIIGQKSVEIGPKTPHPP